MFLPGRKRRYKSLIGPFILCTFALKALIGPAHALLLTPAGAPGKSGDPCPMHMEEAGHDSPESCVCEAGDCCIASGDRFAHTVDEISPPVAPAPSPILRAFANPAADITPLLAYAPRAPPGVPFI